MLPIRTFCVWSLLAVLPGKAQPQPLNRAVQVYITTPFIGVGISGRPSEITGRAVTAILSLPIELRHRWTVIPEYQGVAFRTPKFTQKTGLVFSHYPRINYESYGVRIGNGLVVPNARVWFRPSIGLSYIKVSEPYISRTGWFGPIYEDKHYHTYAIPVQLDTRFLLSRSNLVALVVGIRWVENGRRPFGSITSGFEISPFAARKSSAQKILN